MSSETLSGRTGRINQTRPWYGLLIVVACLSGILVALLPFNLAVAVILGLGLLVLILIQPMIGVGLTLVAGPLGAVESLQYGSSFPKSGQILFALTVFAWLGYGVLRRRIYIVRSPLLIPLALFVSISLLSLIGEASLNYGLKEVLKWLEMGLFMLLVADLALNWKPLKDCYNRKRDLNGIDYRWILFLIFVAGMSQAAIGIWQFGLRGDGPEHFLIMDRFYRAFGTFQQPNPYGGYMGMMCLLAIGTTFGILVTLVNRFRRGDTISLTEWLWLGFAIVASLSFGLGLLMSWSRGAWIGFFAGAVMMAFFLPRRRWQGVLLLFLVSLAIIIGLKLDLIPATFSDRLASFGEELSIRDVRGVFVTVENFAIIERLAHWQAGLNMARDHLWIGLGFGNYEPAYPDYGLLNWPHPLGHAHNYYINLLAETGILGTLSYLLFWIIVFWQVIKALKGSPWPGRGALLGLIAVWTALAIHHLFDKLYVNNIYLFLGVLLGLQQVLAIKNESNYR